jgi:hypothetical protein
MGSKSDSGQYILTVAAAENYTNLWSAQDIYSTMRLPIEKAALVVAHLDEPLGLRRVIPVDDCPPESQEKGGTPASWHDSMALVRQDATAEEACAFLLGLELPALKVRCPP